MKTFIQFINSANKKYNNKFDYSKSSYVNVTTKIDIICPTHGLFQQTPFEHLHKKHGCKDCGNDHMAQLQKENSRIKFFNKCSNLYDYSKVHYIDSHTKVNIICKEHGDFFVSPTHHIHMGTGCPKCANYTRAIYSEKFFIKNPESQDIPALLYIFSIIDSDGTKFVKVGITRKSAASARYRKYRKLHGNKEYEKELSLFEAFRLEQSILNNFKVDRYMPKEILSGNTECILYTTLENILKFLH